MTCFGLAHPRKPTMLTEPVFFDTDCLSSFLTMHEEDVLVELYTNRIRVPAVVRRELSPPWRPDLRDAIDGFLNSGKATLQDIDVGSEAHDLFRQLTNLSSPGVKALGNGEAACLVLARANEGVIASNNLRDVMSRVREYHLRLATTGIIIYEAVGRQILTRGQAVIVWEQMVDRGFQLGALTYDDYIRKKGYDLR